MSVDNAYAVPRTEVQEKSEFTRGAGLPTLGKPARRPRNAGAIG